MLREPVGQLAPAVPDGLPICGKCGIVAPTEHAFCAVCDAALGPQRIPAPAVADGLVWISISVRFECRACRQLAPLNHLDVDGLVKCMHCGVEQRFEVGRWQGVIRHAQRVAEQTTPLTLHSTPTALEGIGKHTAFATARVDDLEVRAAPGHPLCEKCSAPLSIAEPTVERLVVACRRCSSQRIYALPRGSSQQFPELRGVVCAEHEVGRRDVQTEVGAGGSIIIRCGNCSAPLPITEDTAVVDCPYCGVACRIAPDMLWRMGNRSLRANWWWLLLQGPSKFDQQPQMPWENDVYARINAGARVNQHPTPSTGFGCVASVVVLAIGGGIGVASYVALRRNDVTTPGLFDGAKQMLADKGRWNGVSAPVVSHLNHDGVFDIIGEVRTVSPEDTIRVAAFDGSTGKNLWRSEVVGTYSEAGMVKLQVVGDQVLLPMEGGRLRSFLRSDGTPKFNIKLHENIEQFCGASEPGLVIVETKDKQHHTLALATGTIQKAEAAGSCHRIGQGLPVVVASGFNGEAPLLRDRVEGMSSDRTIRLPNSKVMLALGIKTPGTRIARIAAFRWDCGLESANQVEGLETKLTAATATQESTLRRHISELRSQLVTSRCPGEPQILWLADVPGVDPLTTSEGSLDVEDIDVLANTLVATYELKAEAHHYRLTAFSVESGQRLWDTDIEDTSPFSGLKLTPHHVFVSRWNGLFAFAVSSGKLVYKIP